MSGTNPFDDSLTSDRVDWVQREEGRQLEETSSVWSEERTPLLPRYREDCGSQRPCNEQDEVRGSAALREDGVAPGGDALRGFGGTTLRETITIKTGTDAMQLSAQGWPVYPDRCQQQNHDGYRLKENFWGRPGEYTRLPREPDVGEYNRVRFPSTEHRNQFGTSNTHRAPVPTFDGTMPWRDYLVQFE
ncbi:hypothetical protein HOLleu_43169 [Holothuria leucospilota]|uniref:Uncharacterized protein n=1 Tax=Holothuria leucospilota TaxID=206669 RepID=A0A9Q0Y9R1_HOLLE|nr:hypothetical protein HOLleu_43169 [Holothuria leucospilota]